jgi:hypothetical protein
MTTTRVRHACVDAVRLFMLSKKKHKKREDEVNLAEKKREGRNEV